MNKQLSDYKIELDAYSGPLDLLLYLIRREEVDIYDIPVARITEQYLEYLNLFSELNINVAGEFVIMAATLIEIKSRMMAPQPEEMPEDELEDPRLELVHQLMEYKRFKEAALALTERAARRAEQFGRAGERVTEDGRPKAAPPTGLAMWALLDAFSRILEQTGRRGPHKIIMDDIPQEKIQADLELKVCAAGRLSFSQLFEGQPNRSILIGVFFALLELVHRQVLRVDQDEPLAEIWLTYVPESERPKFEEAELAVDESKPEPEGPGADAAECWSVDEFPGDLPEVPEVDDPETEERGENQTPDADSSPE